jgi:hypothetical protein
VGFEPGQIGRRVLAKATLRPSGRVPLRWVLAERVPARHAGWAQIGTLDPVLPRDDHGHQPHRTPHD